MHLLCKLIQRYTLHTYSNLFSRKFLIEITLSRKYSCSLLENVIFILGPISNSI